MLDYADVAECLHHGRSAGRARRLAEAYSSLAEQIASRKASPTALDPPAMLERIRKLEHENKRLRILLQATAGHLVEVEQRLAFLYGRLDIEPAT